MIFQLLVYWRVVFQGEVIAGCKPKVLRVDHQCPPMTAAFDWNDGEGDGRIFEADPLMQGTIFQGKWVKVLESA